MPDLKTLLADDINHLASIHPIQEVKWAEMEKMGLRFSVKREDLLHPIASGNKLYKLWGHLKHASAGNAHYLMSFGGAYSNHLHALAAAGEALGIATLGVVRGERRSALTPTLQDCESMGMELHFVSRAEYQMKDKGAVAQGLCERYPNTYVVPEGGGGDAGEEYCSVLMREVEGSSDLPAVLCVPCGTGTTLRGLIKSGSGKVPLMGFSALKASPSDCINGVPRIVSEIESETGYRHGDRWCVEFESARRGFAKGDQALFDFIEGFYRETGILLEPVYTGKMMLRILELAREGFWERGQHIAAIHTGGLQGLRGYPQLGELLNVSRPAP